MVRAAMDPCLRGILAAKPPDISEFEDTFDLFERKKGKLEEKVTLATLRSPTDTPLAVLTFNTYQDSTFCELWVNDSRQSLDEVLRAVIRIVEAIPDIREGKPRTRGDEPELKAWRLKRKNAYRYADFVVSIHDQRFVALKMEQANGLFR